MAAQKSGRVIIVGGGISGLSSAIALQQAGFDAHVFERASEVRKITVGGGFTMWPNSMTALHEISMDDRVHAAGAAFEEAEFRTRRGRLIAMWPVGKLARKHGTSAACIDRADLVRVLVDALDDDALHLGETCTGFEQDAAGVTAKFASGREERGDVLVAADAMGSVIRGQLYGKFQPKYAGYILWQGYAPDPSQDPAPHGLFRVAYGQGKRFVFHHVGGQRLFWQSIATVPEGFPDPATPEAKKAMIQERHRGWLQPTERILEATDPTTISRLDIYYADPDYRWGEGRVTMVGDAAHPILFNLGQGAAQSIEDGVMLARCLSANGDPVAALRTYESLRKDRAIGIQKMAKLLGQAAQMKNPAACFIRDQVLTVMFRTIVLKKQEQDFAYHLPLQASAEPTPVVVA